MNAQQIVSLNFQREKVLEAVAQMEEVTARIKEDLGEPVTEETGFVRRASLERYLAADLALTMAIAKHEVSVVIALKS